MICSDRHILKVCVEPDVFNVGFLDGESAGVLQSYRGRGDESQRRLDEIVDSSGGCVGLDDWWGVDYLPGEYVVQGGGVFTWAGGSFIEGGIVAR